MRYMRCRREGGEERTEVVEVPIVSLLRENDPFRTTRRGIQQKQAAAAAYQPSVLATELMENTKEEDAQQIDHIDDIRTVGDFRSYIKFVNGRFIEMRKRNIKFGPKLGEYESDGQKNHRTQPIL